eukprot:2334818-Heterocapsa_arctica.AAC.1
MHGGSRDKWTTLRSNAHTFERLAVSRDGSHEHELWGPKLVCDRFSRGFHTAQEAEYPPELCQRMAHA